MNDVNNNPSIIRVNRASKIFKLPHERTNTIKGAVINFYKRNNRFEKQRVLEDISFEVKKGEFFGIVGRNGSGKSTLLKLLAGIYSPDKGGIEINGKLTPFIELGVGFSPELTGRENVFLNGALLGFNRQEMFGMYEDIVEFAELERFMDQKLKNYSSGMQVRLAFSIAIQVKSDILLIDEVLAVGDAAFQRKCFDYFMLLKKQKATVILVTHDMAAVRQYCDRAIMIEKGHIVKRGNPETIARTYLQLFIEEANEKTDNETGKSIPTLQDRWGNAKLQVQETNVTVTNKNIILNARYIAKKSLPGPVLGFTIYSPSGLNIVEGNTLRSQVKTPSIEPGETITIEWQIPNIFANGDYDISIACCDQSTTEFYDWLNKAASFSINKETTTAGAVDLIIDTIRVVKG